MKDLKFDGMTELQDAEVMEVNGGEWISLAIALIGAGIYIYNEWDDFAAGFNEGYDASRNK